LQHVGGKLGIPQDAEQKPPQLVAVIHVQGGHDGWVELALLHRRLLIGG